ncbi:MAG: hypothetical protein COV29_04520 [Candidatus Yanofskybacteria bacterium CG10_big_fil_rev_8_21_14_0_10_36_16]|uniref:TraC-like domain-containing protein n=1 Tax=Candidatus Yanofskybacteria bacterium CG10_big_fil_rev_8_21_14_0_10_36_16 TaxID=1975096 RepID=A0A2J0Q6H4_9BACT|nr:MAG: hypothetical protein COV29_04520 [Candidatus Yanofskybacteria bacterium CG10_big_fil_rev_8_21_14_0_10_36_16]
MAEQNKTTQTTSTQDFVDVADIRESVVVLKNGGLRSVVEVGSMNFELKSPSEQEAIINAFKEFLNSIDFSIQIVVNSRKLDIRPYLAYLDTLTQSVEHELLKVQAAEYSRFVKGLTELANIMSKKFYIIVPFNPSIRIEASKKGIFNTIKNILNPSQESKTLTEDEFRTYRLQLNQRVELVLSNIGRLGINSKIIVKKELLEMYKKLYNPTENV